MFDYLHSIFDGFPFIYQEDASGFYDCHRGRKFWFEYYRPMAELRLGVVSSPVNSAHLSFLPFVSLMSRGKTFSKEKRRDWISYWSSSYFSQAPPPLAGQPCWYNIHRPKGLGPDGRDAQCCLDSSWRNSSFSVDPDNNNNNNFKQLDNHSNLKKKQPAHHIILPGTKGKKNKKVICDLCVCMCVCVECLCNIFRLEFLHQIILKQFRLISWAWKQSGRLMTRAAVAGTQKKFKWVRVLLSPSLCVVRDWNPKFYTVGNTTTGQINFLKIWDFYNMIRL